MMRLKPLPVSLLLVIFVPVILEAQVLNNDQMKYQRAVQELESVLDSASKFEPLLGVKVKSKGASLLWKQSPERARALFLKLWDFIEQQDAKSLDQEEAQTALLRYLYPKDRVLANQLLQKLTAKTPPDQQFSFDRIAGREKGPNRLARLAEQLLSSDATLAAKLLEQSFDHNTAPQAVLILSRLREIDPLLANFVVRQALENMRRQPKTIGVIGLTHMISYLFPLTPSPDATIEVEQSDEALRIEFMSVGYQILKESLSESDDVLKQLDGQGQQFRTFSQGFTAATLAALASRYAPNLAPELTVISSQLLRGLPPQMSQGANMQAAVVRSAAEESEGAATSIVPVIARGEFDKAQSVIDKLKDENMKKIYTDLLLKARFKAAIATADLDGALRMARTVSNTTSRMQMFVEAARLAHKKRESAVTAQILVEARNAAASPTIPGPHARAVFALAAETAYFSPADAMITLEEGVKQLHHLPKMDATKPSPLNDPDRFVDFPEVARAFANVARDYFDESLAIAAKLENKAVAAVARLAAIERTLKMIPPTDAATPARPAGTPKKN